MLTESEWTWLKAREIWQARHHLYSKNEYFAWSGYLNEIFDLKDALEFSERVAVKLAEGIAIIPYLRPADALKFARFAVEEEMDADGK